MNWRLRKKKRIGEFREFGFPIEFHIASTLTVDERNALLEDWIISAIEANGLLFGGGGAAHVWQGFVTLNSEGSATEEHRRRLEEWLQHEPRILKYRVGPLTDAWHGNCDAWYELEE